MLTGSNIALGLCCNTDIKLKGLSPLNTSVSFPPTSRINRHRNYKSKYTSFGERMV